MGTRITIEESENAAIKELIDVLNGRETPFKLPSMMNWPDANKKRAQSERALRLMLAGLESIKKDFPKEIINQESSLNSSKQEKSEALAGW